MSTDGALIKAARPANSVCNRNMAEELQSASAIVSLLILPCDSQDMRCTTRDATTESSRLTLSTTDLAMELKKLRIPDLHPPPLPPPSTTFGLRHRTPPSPAQGPAANYQRDESCPSLERTHLIISRASRSCQEVRRMMRRRAGCKKEEEAGRRRWTCVRVSVTTVPFHRYRFTTTHVAH